jgi:hypothetical protein
MMYLNTIATTALRDLEREREAHLRETRIMVALATRATRSALVTHQEAPNRPAPERAPRWRLTLPWRAADLAEAA